MLNFLIFILFVVIAFIVFNFHSKYYGGGEPIVIPYNSEIHAIEVKKIDDEAFPELIDMNTDFSKQKGWVLSDDEKVVGFCLYEEIEDGWYFSDFVVTNAYSGKGYGGKMLDELISAADKAGIKMITRAYKGHEYLVKLYTKYGFESQPNSENRLGSPLMIRHAKKQ